MPFTTEVTLDVQQKILSVKLEIICIHSNCHNQMERLHISFPIAGTFCCSDSSHSKGSTVNSTVKCSSPRVTATMRQKYTQTSLHPRENIEVERQKRLQVISVCDTETVRNLLHAKQTTLQAELHTQYFSPQTQSPCLHLCKFRKFCWRKTMCKDWQLFPFCVFAVIRKFQGITT